MKGALTCALGASLVAMAAAFGHFPADVTSVDLTLHEDVGWCGSDLDEEPCDWEEMDHSYADDSELAAACYAACVTDYPDYDIDNVEYGYSYHDDGDCQSGCNPYCYCQSGCPCMYSCPTADNPYASNAATVDPDFEFPECCPEDDDDDDYDWSCTYDCSGFSDCVEADDDDGGDDDSRSWSYSYDCDNSFICSDGGAADCTVDCDESSFATYAEIDNYCKPDLCDRRRKLGGTSASSKFSKTMKKLNKQSRKAKKSSS